MLVSLPNLPDPTAADEDAVVREVGEAGRDRRRTTSSSPASASTWSAGRGCPARASPTCAATSSCSSSRSCAGRMEKLVGHGFEPVIPPVLVREEALYGTGFLPDTEQQIYHLPDDDLYLVGHERGRARLAARGRDPRRELPLRYAGFSSCFRREAGAAGKDTRGIFRVHQFDKVEMFSFVEPDASREEHERLLAHRGGDPAGARRSPTASSTSRVDDLGASAAKKYDCEAWLPGQERYRELTSTSNTTDFQARRLEIRYRPSEGARPEIAAHAQRHRGRRGAT